MTCQVILLLICIAYIQCHNTIIVTAAVISCVLLIVGILSCVLSNVGMAIYISHLRRIESNKSGAAGGFKEVSIFMLQISEINFCPWILKFGRHG